MGARGPKPGSPRRGGRQKGTKNKIIPYKYSAPGMAEKLASLDYAGKSMAAIQIDAARWMTEYADQQRALGNLDVASRYDAQAAKIAHDVSPYLYATQQSVKHGGDEGAAPIRIESLSDYQLEKLIERLRRS